MISKDPDTNRRATKIQIAGTNRRLKLSMDSESNPPPASLNANASPSANTQARQRICTIWILAIMPCVFWMNWLKAVAVTEW